MWNSTGRTDTARAVASSAFRRPVARKVSISRSRGVRSGISGRDSSSVAALVAGRALLPSTRTPHCAVGAESTLARLDALAALGPIARPLALVPHYPSAGIGALERLADLGERHGVSVAAPIFEDSRTRAAVLVVGPTSPQRTLA